MFKKNLLLIFLILSFQQTLSAETIKVFNFTELEFETLKVKKIRGADSKTKYSLGKNEYGNFIRSVSENAASGLGKEIKINLSKTPFLNITWKVEKDLSGINENSKKGHDYAARVFVIKKTGATFLSNRAMNYVYSSNNEIDSHQPSPYTKKSIDYVLSTTKKSLNEWVTVKVNVKEHFKKFHNLYNYGSIELHTNINIIKQQWSSINLVYYFISYLFLFFRIINAFL